MPRNLEKVQNYPQTVKWATLFRTKPVILLLQVSSLTSLYFVWFVENGQINQSKGENLHFGIVIRVFVCFVFAHETESLFSLSNCISLFFYILNKCFPMTMWKWKGLPRPLRKFLCKKRFFHSFHVKENKKKSNIGLTK